MNITEQANQLAQDLGYETYESAPVEIRREIAGGMAYVKELAERINR